MSSSLVLFAISISISNSRLDLSSRALSVLPGGQQFIAMHIRRSDFATWCKPHIPKEECLPQLPAFVLRIHEIKEELRQRWAVSVGLGSSSGSSEMGQVGGESEWDIKHILVTSDEPLIDPANPGEQNPFWTRPFSYGWVTIDHVTEQTEEKYGA